MKHELKHKAWGINLNKVKEAYFYDHSDFIVHAETRNQAKSLLISQYGIRDMELISGEEMNYITLPVKRAPEYDIFIYEGKELTLSQINEKIAINQRKKQFDDILADENITHCYIMKRGSFYSQGYSGYTDYRQFAGVYPKSDAVRHALGCDDINLRPIENKEHNKLIRECISTLNRKLIDSPEYQNIFLLESERFKWSKETFPESTAESSIRKLISEADEIIQNIREGIKDSEEYADALMCLFDAAGRQGIKVEEIFYAFHHKFQKNKLRKWAKNPDNSYSHIKP